MEIAGWHLSLKNAKLSQPVSLALAAKAPCTLAAVDEVLSRIPVRLGGGALEVPLSQCVPKRCREDLAQLTERYARGDL
jgi:Protein of unknown function (DUF3181)